MPISANGGPWTNSGSGLKTLAVVPVTAGDLLVLSFNGGATAFSSSVSGGGVTTWQMASGYLDTSDSVTVEIWWGVVTATGSATITVTNSTATGFNRLHCREWTGSASWAVLAASPSPSTSGGAPFATGATVNYQSLTGSGLYVGHADSVFGNMTGGATSGFTYEQNNGHQEVCFNTAAVNAAPTSTTDNAGGYEVCAALFGPASNPVPPPNQQQAARIRVRRRTQPILPAPPSSGPVNYPETLAASLLVTGAVQRQARPVLLGSLVLAGSLARQAVRALAAPLVVAGNLARGTGRALAVALAVAAACARNPGKVFNAAVAVAASTARNPGKLLAAPVTVAGPLTRRAGQLLPAAVSVAGTAGRGISRVLPGSVTISGGLTAIKVRLLTFAASLPAAVTLTRQTGKTLQAQASAGAAVSRSVSRPLHAGLAVTGSVTRSIGRTLLAAVTWAGSLLTGSAHFIALNASVVLSGAGSFVKAKLLTLAASVGLNASVRRQVTSNLPASGVVTPALARGITRTLTAPVGLAGALGRGISRALRAAAGLAGSGSFSHGGTNYPLTFNASAAVSAAWSGFTNRLIVLFSVVSARQKWAVSKARQLWAVVKGRNGTS